MHWVPQKIFLVKKTYNELLKNAWKTERKINIKSKNNIDKMYYFTL